jgi:hypothetical protein
MSLEAAIHMDMYSGTTETHGAAKVNLFAKSCGNGAIENVEDVNNTNHPSIASI